MKKEISTKNVLFMVVLLNFVLSDFVFGAGLDGISKVSTTFADALLTIAGSIIVIAIIWAGFKVAFGAGWADVSNVVMGSLIIGSAGLIASLLLGTSAITKISGAIK